MPRRRPDYERIADDLRRRIRSGELRPGERLPSNDEMAREYGCSVQPVKVAVRDLEREGLIEGHPGKGKFVA